MDSVRRTLFCLGAAAVCLTGAGLSAADGPRRDGKWETTMRMEMPGLPVKLPPVVSVVCVTKEDAADPDKSVPKASNDSSCNVYDYEVDGQTVSWKWKCKGKKGGSGEGTLTYSADSYKGEMVMEAEDQEMVMKLSGKRLGDCEE